MEKVKISNKFEIEEMEKGRLNHFMEKVYAINQKQNKSPGCISYTEKAELCNAKALYVLMYVFVLCNFVMPPYLGVHIGFDFTVVRLLNIVILGYFCLNQAAGRLFISLIKRCKLTPFIAVYLFVALYTGIFRIDVNTFFSPILDFLTFYMVLYAARYVIGVRTSLRIVVGSAWFLGIYGLVEYVYGQSLMLQFLSTMWTTVVNSYRSGQYRIMGPCGHSIGYGLLLLLLIAIVCIDYDRREMNLFKRPVLIAILLLNSFLTGSRAALAFCIVECVLIAILSKHAVRKKTLFYTIVLLLFGILLELALINTDIGRYVMMQITSVIDSAFGTSLAANFGADTLWLQQSSSYRTKLPKIFLIDWLNPIIGRGLNNFWGCEIEGVHLVSIDNYYVQMYIQYAYPGLIAHVVFFLCALYFMIKTAVRRNANFCLAMSIGCLLYLVNLWFVDSLATLKYAYSVIAISYAYYMTRYNEK